MDELINAICDEMDISTTMTKIKQTQKAKAAAEAYLRGLRRALSIVLASKREKDALNMRNMSNVWEADETFSKYMKERL